MNKADPASYEAVAMTTPRYYAVKPKGQLGTMGWSPLPWDVTYVSAHSPQQAIAKVIKAWQNKELLK